MAERTRLVTIPYAPRPLQRAIHEQLEATRFVVAVCHRRFGKTVAAVNHLLKCALLCTKLRGRFYYIAPTFRQGKAVAWDYLKHYSAVIPQVEVNESELRVDLPTGGQVRIFGADNPDSLRGLYADGVVLDEYGMMAPNAFSEVIRPLLADRKGWALFIGTPNGKNQFYEIAQHAKAAPEDWAFVEHKVSATGYVDADELLAARSVMTADEYAQEFECSFEASVKGSVYARELQTAREQGRITSVPYDPMLPVDTGWDLGIGDATAIWFSQSSPSGEVRLIDYYESSGQGLDHYAGILNRRPYAYGQHWAPHDIQVRELTSGRSRLEAARSLGIQFTVVPQAKLEDGINAARMIFPRCWFDATKCKDGIEALQHYRWDWNTRINEFKSLPVHDWASHGADAFRCLAAKQWTPSRKVIPLWQQQKDVDEYDIARVKAQRRAGMGRGGY